MASEIWKDINGFDGKYQISNNGNVRSFSRWKNGKMLKPGKCGNPGPYMFVTLVKTSRADAKNYYIHRLVAEAFLAKTLGKTEVNHKDGDTLNNNVSNLEWCTHAENMEHANRTGILTEAHDNEKGEKNPRSKPVLQYDTDGNFIREWGSVNQIMRETGIPANYIFKCCNPEKYKSAKTARGFVWRYKNGETNSKNTT